MRYGYLTSRSTIWSCASLQPLEQPHRTRCAIAIANASLSKDFDFQNYRQQISSADLP
jgi:hypothetical protein